MDIISQEFLQFIADHRHEKPADIKLKFANKNIGFSLDFAITQIEARQRTASKIPSFIEKQDFVFPSLIAAEQATNEAVARFHASLINASKVLDLTAGLGIDDMSMAMSGTSVTACEIDPAKCDALIHNANSFGLNDRLSVHCGDSIEYLRSSTISFDVIFADPARRSSSGNRTHALSDCTPDILEAMPLIMSKTQRLLVKASPMLDLTEIKKTVENLYHIHIVCFRGECKEVLLDIRNDSSLNIPHSSLNNSSLFTGTTVTDLDWNSPISVFKIPTFAPVTELENLSVAAPPLGGTGAFLYEPNAGVMKTGAWPSLVNKFPNLVKADTNTHLFFSDTLYEDFPGRVMQILSILDKKALKALKGAKINVAARNYPLSAPQLEKKLGVKPGGDRMLYAFRLSSAPIIVITRPLQTSRP